MFKRFFKNTKAADWFRESVNVTRRKDGYWTVVAGKKVIMSKSLSDAMELMAIYLQNVDKGDEQ